MSFFVRDNHGLERPETPGQYKDALKLLEAEGKVVAKPPASERREDTMADYVEIQFPRRESNMATNSSIEWTDTT